jgi:hypothetical protein
VFDRRNVVAGLETAELDAALQGRVTMVGGDFFESIPAADLYLLKHILHDWDDEACIRILTNCRRGLPSGGRVAVVEYLLGDVGEAGLAPMLDLNMMTLFSSRERTLNEYQQLFKSAGLSIAKVVRPQIPVTILVAI